MLYLPVWLRISLVEFYVRLSTKVLLTGESRYNIRVFGSLPLLEIFELLLFNLSTTVENFVFFPSSLLFSSLAIRIHMSEAGIFFSNFQAFNFSFHFRSLAMGISELVRVE